MTLLLMVGSPASAQESADMTPAEKALKIENLQKRLDESGNPLGIRVEGYEEFEIEPLQENTSSDDGNVSGPNRGAAYITTEARHFISYMSLDGKKDSIRLSAIIYTQAEKHDYYFDKLLINCHPTVTSLFEAPSGGNPVDGDIKRIVDDNYMVVCPDYCGYGITAYKQHPYLIHDVTARNCVDAAMAAKEYGKVLLESKSKSIPSSFATFIVGYSQGGATALACAKYLESDACPESYKTALNLHETVCGDGPYSSVATVKKYLEWGKQGKNMEYPCVLPLIVMAAKEAYGDGCMRTVEVEKFFSPEFLATNVFKMLKNKSLTTIDLNKAIKEQMDNHLLPTDIFSDLIINKETGDFNTTTNEYKCLMRALETNELAKGWEPQHKITFWHLENDGVVPYSNFEAVFANEGISHKKDGSVNNNVGSLSPDVWIQESLVMSLSGLPYNQISVPVPLPVPPSFISIGWQKAKLDELNHAIGGKWFYILYLFKDDYLR